MIKFDITRRRFLTYCGTGFALIVGPRPSLAQSAAAYGVTPNSRKDQSAAFQRMVNKATFSGVAVSLPSGSYIISNISLPDGAKLIGERDGVILKGTGQGPVLAAADCTQVSLENLQIDGRGTSAVNDNEGLLNFRNVINLSLRLLAVGNGKRDGIYVERCGGSIEGCVISKAERIGIFAVQSAGLTIASNSVTRCGNGGIIVQRWERRDDGTRVTRNNVSHIGATRGGTGQWGNGINVFQADNVVVQNNDVSDCAFSAIRMNSSSNTLIKNNRCLRSGETAIYAEFAYRDVTITYNVIDGAANGISATNFNNGGRGAIITNNSVRNLTAPGPYKPEAPFFGHGISVEADAVVANNRIETANGFGINAGWGPYLKNVEVTGNTIRNAKIGIGVSVAEGAGRAVIRDNRINAREGAIRAHRWDKIDPVDLALSPSDAPPNLDIRGNKTF